MSARDFSCARYIPNCPCRWRRSNPLVSLTESAGRQPLGQHPVLMLVALSGTGKSTALELLRGRLGLASAEVIPTRRELTDWVSVPAGAGAGG